MVYPPWQQALGCWWWFVVKHIFYWMMPTYLANLHSQYKSHPFIPFILIPIWLDVPSHMLIIASRSKGLSERGPENNFWILAWKTTTETERLVRAEMIFSFRWKKGLNGTFIFSRSFFWMRGYCKGSNGYYHDFYGWRAGGERVCGQNTNSERQRKQSKTHNKRNLSTQPCNLSCPHQWSSNM